MQKCNIAGVSWQHPRSSRVHALSANAYCSIDERWPLCRLPPQARSCWRQSGSGRRQRRLRARPATCRLKNKQVHWRPGLTCGSTISGCNEGIGNGNVHTWLRSYMLRRPEPICGTAARQRIPWDQTVIAGPDATQRGPALGIATELEAEGYHDAEPVGRGGFGCFASRRNALRRPTAVWPMTRSRRTSGISH
jgi:hypothetical protein